MNKKAFVLLTMMSMSISACGSLITASPSLIPSTQTPPSASKTKPTGALMIWQSNDSPCQTAVFSRENLSYGECGGLLTTSPANTTGQEPRLSEISGIYTSFTAETSAGSLIFKGTGNLVPADAEKRAIAEWARLMFQVAQAGRTGSSWALAFAWHREGGPGEFCDDVAVYLTGWATASNCKGFNAQTYLSASNLEQLYGWVDRLGNIDYDDSNAPLAVDMNMTLVLTGNGQEEADEATIREIMDFAATLSAQLGYAATADPQVNEAEQGLRDYLVALHSHNYILGAKLYGGDTGLLETWNPDIPRDDLPALFERACTQNGLQCLAPRTITYRGSGSGDGYHFFVEFSNDDGTLFHQGPCCGETSGTPVSLFPFFVEKSLSGSGYSTLDFPPYVP